MNTYSPSRLSAYENCLARGKFYAARTPTDSAELRDVGSCVHLILYSRSRKQAEPDLSRFPAENIKQAYDIADRVAVRIEEPEIDQRFEFGAAVDKNWKPVAFDAPDAMLRCVFDVVGCNEDLIDGEFYGQVASSTDYKSGWLAPKAEGIQGIVHILLLHALYPDAERYEANFQNVRTGKTDKITVDVDAVDGTGAGTIQRYRQIVLDKIKRAEAGDGAASVGGACMTCPYHRQCEPFQAAAIETMNPADPLNMAKLYLAATAHLDDLDARMRAIVEVIGNVHNGGVEIGFLPSENSTVDFEKLVRDWQADGGELAAVIKMLKPGKQVVRPIISALAKQRKKKVYETEAEYVSITESRRWGHRKGKD